MLFLAVLTRIIMNLKRLWAKAADGTLVPVSIVYKKGFVKDGKAPLLLYGYGSYGIFNRSGFQINNTESS